jgi:DNA-binding transcriptional LysR family regulator
MDAGHVRLLIDIAQRGSFAAVARARGIDPSSVSRMIAAIEGELGFRLFQRTTRRVVPTEAGALYLRRVEAIAEELEQARDAALAVSTGPVGVLRMTTTVAFGEKIVVPLLPRFRAAFPGVALDVVLSDANLDLIAERIDLAVRLGPGVAGDLVVSKLMDTRYCVCASPGYLRRAGRPRAPADLAPRDCLLAALPGFRSRWIFRNAAGALTEVAVKGAITVSGALALRSLALAGAGPALLADWLAGADLAAGRLVDLFPKHRVTATTFETAVWLLYPSRAFLPHKVRAMIDFLRSAAGVAAKPRSSRRSSEAAW